MNDEQDAFTITLTRFPGCRMVVVDTYESRIDENSTRDVDAGLCGNLSAVVAKLVDDWQHDGLPWRQKCRIVVGQMKSLAVQYPEIADFVKRMPEILGYDENGRNVPEKETP